MVQRPRGTRDFGPGEMAVRRAVAGRLEAVFSSFGYQAVQTPTFEELELFTAKSGEGILKELYDFADKGGRRMALRPELTAPVMRLYFQEHFNDPKPVKWYYFGNCFRYDRPQAARYREFWQFGCEQIGAGGPLAYAELLALADAAVKGIGIREREFSVGHVGILKALVARLGVPAEGVGAVMRAIDKGDMVALDAAAREAPRDALEALQQAIAARSVDDVRRHLSFGGVEGPVAELEAVMDHLEAFGVQAEVNVGIARGLDYYTGIVFEMQCPILGAEKQILGGGGYDLAPLFGAAPTPTMGFGLGFDRAIVALEKQEGAPPAAPPKPHAYFAALGPAALAEVIPIVARLRREHVAVELDLMSRKPAAVAKHADAVGARHLIVVGERDLAAGKVQVKELSTGAQVEVALGRLLEHLLPRA
ncbi:MAG: histidine--tRNA ligase [Thermoplasmatota archaeon]